MDNNTCYMKTIYLNEVITESFVNLEAPKITTCLAIRHTEHVWHFGMPMCDMLIERMPLYKWMYGCYSTSFFSSMRVNR